MDKSKYTLVNRHIAGVVRKTIPPVKHECRLIPGYSHYCISSVGVCYSCRTRGGVITEWTAMVSKPGRQGRLHCNLRSGGKTWCLQVHTLVLLAFVGQCPDGMEGCHNDGNHLNNSVGNLRWDTHKNNMADRNAHGTAPKGEKNPAAILNRFKAAHIRLMNKCGLLQYEIALLFGVAKQTIQVICSGEIWREETLYPLPERRMF